MEESDLPNQDRTISSVVICWFVSDDIADDIGVEFTSSPRSWDRHPVRNKGPPSPLLIASSTKSIISVGRPRTAITGDANHALAAFSRSKRRRQFDLRGSGKVSATSAGNRSDGDHVRRRRLIWRNKATGGNSRKSADADFAAKTGSRPGEAFLAPQSYRSSTTADRPSFRFGRSTIDRNPEGRAAILSSP